MMFISFDKFAETIEVLPPCKILPAFELEYRSLQKELASVNAQPTGDHLSISAFRSFVYSMRLGQQLKAAKPLPIHCLDFFKKVVVKLVEIKELPESAFREFDKAFMPR